MPRGSKQFLKKKVNFTQHATNLNSDWGFRVTSNSREGLCARYTEAATTLMSAKSHLLDWKTHNSPWVSVYVDWKSALDRAQRYVSNGEEDVKIMIIDLRTASPSIILDAETLAQSAEIWHPENYWNEVLICKNVNEHAWVASVPVSGGIRTVNSKLGRLIIPEGLKGGAHGVKNEDVQKWLEVEMKRKTGNSDQDSIEAMMKKMSI